MKFFTQQFSILDVNNFKCKISGKLMKKSSALAGMVYKYFDIFLAASIILSLSLLLLIGVFLPV